MDRSEAYRILNLPYGSSEEQIQKQFSKLVVKFKPDENPTEFMQVHMAYKLLTQGSGYHSDGNSSHWGEDDSSDEIFDEWDDEFQKLDENFDMKEQRRKLEEDRKRRLIEEQKKLAREKAALAARAKLQELQTIIFQEESKRNLKLLQNFFKQKETKEVLLELDFMNGINDLFNQRVICQNYCNAILKAYDFYIPNDARDTYRISMRRFLLEKYNRAPDMLPEPMNWKLLLPFILCFALLNYSMELNPVENLFQCALVCVFVAIERILRKKLHRRKYTAYHLASMVCVISGFLFAESYAGQNSPSFDWIMCLWCWWFIFAFATALISCKRAFFRFSYLHEKK